MKKKVGIMLGIVILFVISIGYYMKQNQRNSSVGVNTEVVNEDKKESASAMDPNKVLVVYFSNGGNTQKLAKEISDQVGGDFRRIEPSIPYPTGDALFDYAEAQQINDERPALQNLNIDISQYETIFIGYPVWWYTYPQIILSFFDEYDVSNKTIVPFVTHGGSGMSGTEEDMRSYLSDKQVTVLNGLAISRDVIEQDQKETISNWLIELGFK